MFVYCRGIVEGGGGSLGGSLADVYIHQVPSKEYYAEEVANYLL